MQTAWTMIANKKVHDRIPVLAVGLVLVLAVAFFCLPVRGQAVPTTEGGTAASEAAERVFVAEPRGPGAAKLYPPQAAARGGLAASSVPVVEKAVLEYRVADVTVDPRKHCMYLCQPPASGQGALRIELERGVTYTVSVAGEAFMSAQTGNDADPFPGIMLYYGTDEEDGYAIRYAVLKPGDSLTFKTPWLISPDDEVFTLAFFLSAWPHGEQRGSYKLTFTRAPGAQADVNYIKFLDVGRDVKLETIPRNPGTGVLFELVDPATRNSPKP